MQTVNKFALLDLSIVVCFWSIFSMSYLKGPLLILLQLYLGFLVSCSLSSGLELISSNIFNLILWIHLLNDVFGHVMLKNMASYPPQILL